MEPDPSSRPEPWRPRPDLDGGRAQAWVPGGSGKAWSGRRVAGAAAMLALTLGLTCLAAIGTSRALSAVRARASWQVPAAAPFSRAVNDPPSAPGAAIGAARAADDCRCAAPPPDFVAGTSVGSVPASWQAPVAAPFSPPVNNPAFASDALPGAAPSSWSDCKTAHQ